MKKDHKNEESLSYESDGQMGKQQQETENKKEEVNFFNTTQNSE